MKLHHLLHHCYKYFQDEEVHCYSFTCFTSKVHTYRKKHVFSFIHAVTHTILYISINMCNLCNNVTPHTDFFCYMTCNNSVTNVTEVMA